MPNSSFLTGNWSGITIYTTHGDTKAKLYVIYCSLLAVKGNSVFIVHSTHSRIQSLASSLKRRFQSFCRARHCVKGKNTFRTPTICKTPPSGYCTEKKEVARRYEKNIKKLQDIKQNKCQWSSTLAPASNTTICIGSQEINHKPDFVTIEF